MSKLDRPDNDPTVLAQLDIEDGFSDSFSSVGAGWRLIEAFTHDGDMSNGRCTAVPWEFNCAHTGEFLGLAPTGEEFAIHGVTIVVVDSDGDSPEIFHRYIDWANVMSHLGLGSTWRPTLKAYPGR